MLDFINLLIEWDHALFTLINGSAANPVTDFIMPLVTADLHLKIFYGVCLLLILWKGDKKLAWAVLFSLLTVLITDQLSSSVLKPIFSRPRPCHTFSVHLLTHCGSGFSFPSSHAANLFGQAFLFKGVAPKSAKYLIPLAVIVALSRVFVGVHYPADIVIGAALGTVAGYGIYHLYLVTLNKYILKTESKGTKDEHSN
jgi:undecaprenyl-diphosphatase